MSVAPLKNSSPHNQRCRLLELPRELRDIIYEYALTYDGGLIADRAVYDDCSQPQLPGYFFPDSDPERRDHNQLKFVCKLLHAETAGLGTHYNDLTFRGGESKTGFEFLQYFISVQCSSRHLSHIRNVILVDPVPPGKDPPVFPTDFNRHTLPPLVAFAKAHTNIKISIRLCHFGVDTCEAYWIVHGSVVQYAMRGTTPFESPLRARKQYHSYSTIVFGENFRFPPNIHLYPAGFDEGMFEKDWSSEYGTEDKRRIIRQCQKWYEDGF